MHEGPQRASRVERRSSTRRGRPGSRRQASVEPARPCEQRLASCREKEEQVREWASRRAAAAAWARVWTRYYNSADDRGGGRLSISTCPVPRRPASTSAISSRRSCRSSSSRRRAPCSSRPARAAANALLASSCRLLVPGANRLPSADGGVATSCGGGSRSGRGPGGGGRGCDGGGGEDEKAAEPDDDQGALADDEVAVLPSVSLGDAGELVGAEIGERVGRGSAVKARRSLMSAPANGMGTVAR